MVGATLASFVVARRRPVPARRARRSRRWSASSPPRCCARASTSRSWPRARYIDIPYLAFVVWAAALEAERPRRGTVGLRAARLRRALRPEAWLLSGLYWLWCVLPATWPQRVALRGARRRSARSSGRRSTGRHRRPAVLAARTRAAWPRSSGAPARAVGGPGATVELPHEPRQGRRSSRRHRSASCSRCVLVPRRVAHAARRCSSSASARSCSSASPGCRSSTATCSCPSLMVMVFAGGRARRLDDAARRARCGRCGRSARSRSSSTAWSSPRRASTLDASTNELTLPRRRRTPRCEALLATRRCAPGCAAARCRCPTTSSIPDVRWMLDAARRRRDRPQRRRSERSRIGRGVAIYAIEPPVAAALGLHRRRRVAEDTVQLVPMAGFTRVAVTRVLRRLCPLLSRPA